MAATLFKMRAGKAPPPLFPCIGHKGACAGRLVPPQRTVRAWGIWLWKKKKVTIYYYCCLGAVSVLI